MGLGPGNGVLLVVRGVKLGLVTWINIIGVRHMDIFEFWG